jgi:hypothetical protein
VNKDNLENKVSESKALSNVTRHDALSLLKKGVFIKDKNYEETKKNFNEAVIILIKSGDEGSQAYSTAAFYAESNQCHDIAVEFYKVSNTFWSLCRAGDIYFKLRDINNAAACYELAIPKANGTKPQTVEKAIKFYRKIGNNEKVEFLSKKYNNKNNKDFLDQN